MKTNYETHREELLKDPELLKEYEIEKKRLSLVHKILQIRKDLNITQKEMAERADKGYIVSANAFKGNIPEKLLSGWVNF